MKEVIRRVLAANIKRRVVELELRLAVVEARNAGCTLREIAAEAGVTGPTILNWEKQGRFRKQWMADEIARDLKRLGELPGPVTQTKQTADTPRG